MNIWGKDYIPEMLGVAMKLKAITPEEIADGLIEEIEERLSHLTKEHQIEVMERLIELLHNSVQAGLTSGDGWHGHKEKGN